MTLSISSVVEEFFKLFFICLSHKFISVLILCSGGKNFLNIWDKLSHTENRSKISIGQTPFVCVFLKHSKDFQANTETACTKKKKSSACTKKLFPLLHLHRTPHSVNRARTIPEH